MSLESILIPDQDIYSVTKKRKDGKKFVTEKRYLIKRDGIRKIAGVAGIKPEVMKTLVVSPSVTNNYMIAFDVTIEDLDGKKTTMLGEASNENTKGIARMYKGLTAERRGYSRAVLVHLGLTNVYGEDEFVLEEEIQDGEIDTTTSHDLPSPEEFVKIKDVISLFTGATNRKELQDAVEKSREIKDELSPEQMNLLRGCHRSALERLGGMSL